MRKLADRRLRELHLVEPQVRQEGADLLPAMFRAATEGMNRILFSPLNGADPGFRVSGIDALVGNPLRPDVATGLDISRQSVEALFRVRGDLFSGLTAANPLGDADRNILRADGTNNLDLVMNRRFRLPFEGHLLNFRVEAYNLTNTRDFGIPNATYNSAAFLNQWNTNGGGRRVVLMLRYQF